MFFVTLFSNPRNYIDFTSRIAEICYFQTSGYKIFARNNLLLMHH